MNIKVRLKQQRWVCRTSKFDVNRKQSVTESMAMTIMNLVTPKVRAKYELLFNKLASEAGLLNKCSCLARALGVTKFIIVSDMILVTLCCPT